jgi:hypothetical protein
VGCRRARACRPPSLKLDAEAVIERLAKEVAEVGFAIQAK